MEIKDFEEIWELIDEFNKINMCNWKISNINPADIKHGEITIRLKKDKKIDISKFEEVSK